MTKRIAVATTSRADFGVMRSVMHRLHEDEGFDLVLVVSGSHLVEAHGHTIDEIRKTGLPIGAEVPCLDEGDDPGAIARAMGRATAGMADALEALRPDALMVLGDRFEMHALAVAAVPFALPIVHVHGGEKTVGAIDDSFRHSMTKLAHLHFVATEAYRDRVLQLGEEAWRVTICGATALDNLDDFAPITRSELERELGVTLPERFLLVTLHPVTREYERAQAHAEALVSALRAVEMPALITAANADTWGSKINTILQDFAVGRGDVSFVKSVGHHRYFSLMSLATAMVGNSSSGIIEAASFGLPVVNIGSRQDGRVRGPNVIDVGHGAAEIEDAIRRATSREHVMLSRSSPNPYRRGHAARVIVDRLRDVLDDPRLWAKDFVDRELP